MEDRLLKNINEMFDSYDLFSNTGRRGNVERMKSVIPDISESEIKELETYLQEFYTYSVEYGSKLARKYRLPFLPSSDEAKNDIKEYVSLCQNKYPQIDEKHIVELFGIVCWLTNR